MSGRLGAQRSPCHRRPVRRCQEHAAAAVHGDRSVPASTLGADRERLRHTSLPEGDLWAVRYQSAGPSRVPGACGAAASGLLRCAAVSAPCLHLGGGARLTVAVLSSPCAVDPCVHSFLKFVQRMHLRASCALKGLWRCGPAARLLLAPLELADTLATTTLQRLTGCSRRGALLRRKPSPHVRWCRTQGNG
jgi:hypothetical protein